jgi:hypothetical protein
MAMRQRGNGDDRSIDQSIAMAMAMGKEDWGNRSNGNRSNGGGNGTVIIAITIDRSCCVDMGRANTIDFYSVCFIRKS